MTPALALQLACGALRVAFKRLRHGGRFAAAFVQRWHRTASIAVRERGRVRLGRNLCLEAWCDFRSTGDGVLCIGDRTHFSRGCLISCQQEVKIGANCLFGPDVKIYDNDHAFDENGLVPSQHKTGAITIGEGTWVAANAVILRGTTIGRHCVIGAGAVVKGEIPDHSKVVATRGLEITPIVKREGRP